MKEAIRPFAFTVLGAGCVPLTIGLKHMYSAANSPMITMIVEYLKRVLCTEFDSTVLLRAVALRAGAHASSIVLASH